MLIKKNSGLSLSKDNIMFRDISLKLRAYQRPMSDIFNKTLWPIWDIVFKNGPIKVFGRQPLKNFN